jgi:NAD(P)-dependent dehydrogenase (short-subunit alcohol dehydrogenase family)
MQRAMTATAQPSATDVHALGREAGTPRLITAAGGATAIAGADVSDPDAAQAAIEALSRQLGPIGLLVNNVGTGGPVGDSWHVGAGH